MVLQKFESNICSINKKLYQFFFFTDIKFKQAFIIENEKMLKLVGGSNKLELEKYQYIIGFKFLLKKSPIFGLSK